MNHQNKHALSVRGAIAPRLCPELAVEIGLNESILFLQLEFWIAISDNVRDGRRWTYQSVRDIQAAFGFWGVATINRTIQSLEEKGLILVGNYNTRKNDKTRWFAIDLEAAARLKSVHVNGFDATDNNEEMAPIRQETPVPHRNEPYRNGTASTQSGTASTQFGTTLPESTSESTSENNAENAARVSRALKATEKTPSQWPEFAQSPACIELAKICRIDLRWGTPKQFWELKRNLPPLLGMGATVEKLGEFAAWWYAGDWRGKAGETPRPHQVREMWTAFEQGRGTAPRRMTMQELDAIAAKYRTPEPN